MVESANRTTDNRSDYRANLCFVFVFDNIFRFIGYAYFGLINKKVLLFALLLLPAAILGLIIGLKADPKINDATVKMAVIVLLIFSGMTLLVINKFGLS